MQQPLTLNTAQIVESAMLTAYYSLKDLESTTIFFTNISYNEMLENVYILTFNLKYNVRTQGI